MQLWSLFSCISSASLISVLSLCLSNGKVTKNVLLLSKHEAFFESDLHDYFKNFVEFVGWEEFDVFGAGVEVTADVSEVGEVSVDRGSIYAIFYYPPLLSPN